MKKLLLSLFLICSMFNAKALDTLTIRQIYDFDPGDTFQYHILSYGVLYSHPTSSLFTIVITGRWYSPTMDTLYYSRERDGVADTILYTDLDAKISLTDTPSQYCPCSCRLRSDTACGGLRNDIFWTNGGDYFDYVYISGLGRVVGAYGRDDGRQTDTSLNSYVKANRRGQTPYYYTGVADIPGARISLYPSPATVQVRLTYPDISGVARFCIYDALGRSVYEQSLSQAESVHLIGGLPPGVYQWQVCDMKGWCRSGRLIKE
ncbi:MAG: T9SS type A sorting domain-containing protein [Bacteroidetes bacterium]|nr:T9SS type A sorting domain-containing protein [Bacteroidota bacterium]